MNSTNPATNESATSEKSAVLYLNEVCVYTNDKDIFWRVKKASNFTGTAKKKKLLMIYLLRGS